MFYSGKSNEQLLNLVINLLKIECGLPVIYGINQSYVKDGDSIGINRAMYVKCFQQHVQLGSGRLVCLSNGSWFYDITCKDKAQAFIFNLISIGFFSGLKLLPFYKQTMLTFWC